MLLRTLLLVTLIQLGAGLAFASNFPDAYLEKALAEAVRGISINIDSLEEGEILPVEFIGRQIYIYRRTNTDLAYLERSNPELTDASTQQRFHASVRREFSSTSSAVWARLVLAAEPIASRLPMRSIDESILVVASWSPTSGCKLIPSTPTERVSESFVFRDPCTGIKFDAAGRALASTSAGRVPLLDIVVPPYHFQRRNVIRLGPITATSIPTLPFSSDELYGSGTPTQRLIGAARYNDIEAVREAIKAGANVRYFRHGQGSPIDAAITGSSIEVIQLLLRHGAQPTPTSEDLARLLGRQEVIILLSESAQ